ncbi:MAG: HNH endonuclease [Gammaproteobacteria bacterium]|nr:HNH endonuclease [Gammaproteobacteria bacterium]
MVEITCIECGTKVNKRKGAKFCGHPCQGVHSRGKPMPTTMRLNQSIAQKKRFKSSPVSAITRSKLSKAAIGKPKSEQFKASMRIIMLDNNNSTVKYLTPEERKSAKLAQTRHYQAIKRNAIPDTADIEAISNFYIDCPSGFHVDHIIPLSKGGLHDLSNLQYLPASVNVSKGNKLPCDWTKYRLKQHLKEFNDTAY